MLSAEWWDINHKPARLSCVGRTVKFTEYTLCPCAPCTLYSQCRLVRPSDTPSHAVIRTRPRHAKEIAALKFKRFDFSSTFSCFSCVFYFWFTFFLLLLFVISVFSTTPSRRCWQKFFLFFLCTDLNWKWIARIPFHLQHFLMTSQTATKTWNNKSKNLLLVVTLRLISFSRSLPVSLLRSLSVSLLLAISFTLG